MEGAGKGGRDTADHVNQDEVTAQKDISKERNTTKAAVLRDNPECPDLVAVAVYDTKPVHFLSMICDSIKWVLKTQKVYSKNKSKVSKLSFLRLNVNNEYNYGMGHVDVADQIHLVYKVNAWHQNYKWWHVIFWWGL